MVLHQLMNETLTLRKNSTGHIFEFRGFVRPNLIMAADARLPVEEGDTIERPLSKSVEIYTVVDRGFIAANLVYRRIIR